MRILAGGTALIIGAARGIGKAIAMRLAQEGINIAFTDLVVDEEHGGREAECELVAPGIQVKGYAGSTVDFGDTAVLVSQVKEDFGPANILINNVGITRDGLVLRITKAQRDAIINVNLESVFSFIYACVPVMMRQRQDSIINMVSVMGVHGNAGQADRAASRAGMIVLAKPVGQEVGPKGIRVNTIAPGFIDMAITQTLPEKIHEEWIDKIPLCHGGTVEDITSRVLFLASDLSSHISGQVIQIDGRTGI